MFRHRFLATGALLGATALLQGCFDSDSSSGPADTSSDDEAGIQSVIFEEEPEWTDPDVRWFEDEAGPAAAPINTLAWRRELLELDRSVTIEIDRPQDEPPTALVTMECAATGLLHLWACAESSLAHVTKDFDDTAVRSMFFKKTRRTDRPHHGWSLLAISGVLIQSENTSRSIDWIRVQTGDIDETIDNVTDLVPREDVLRLPPNTEVTLTASTGDETDGVFLHLRHARRRLELQSNGDGTFTGVYQTGHRPGLCHAVVDVLSNGTLYDDEEPYDNIAWGFPYVIEGAVDDSLYDGDEE